METSSTSNLNEISVRYSELKLNFLLTESFSKKYRRIFEKLNKKKYLQSEKGNGECYYRDWRGIIELCGLDRYYEYVNKSPDHMEQLLEKWCNNTDNSYPEANVGNLLIFLQKIDRHDVYDDLKKSLEENLEEDIKKFEEKKKRGKNLERKEASTIERKDVPRMEENKPLIIYDAFVLFEDEDEPFVAVLIKKLRTDGYEICTKNDLGIVDFFEHVTIVNLIEKKCKRVIAVISKNFLNSPSHANRFLFDFVQAEQVASKSVKIIPVVLEKEILGNLPLNVKHLHMLHYYRNSNLYDFWSNLDKSLMESSFNGANNQQNSSDQDLEQEIVQNEQHPSEGPPTFPPNDTLHQAHVVDILPPPPNSDLTNSVSNREHENSRPKKSLKKKIISKLFK